MIGLTYNGDGSTTGSIGHLYSGQEWAQLFAVTWCHISIWTFGHAIEAEAISEAIMPFSFSFLMLSSIVGGWNSDLAGPGYRDFYQIMPFHWSINLERYILFKSCRQLRGISSGILVAYFIVTVSGFLYFALRNEFKKVSDKRTPVIADGGDKAEADDSALFIKQNQSVEEYAVVPADEV